MFKKYFKGRSLRYGIYGMLWASFLIVLRTYILVDAWGFWYFLVISTWGVSGIVFGHTIERLHMALQTDQLTNLYNYNSLRIKLDEELSRARKKKEDLSMLLIDIDYFKIINDVHGHLAGDKMLSVLAQIITDSFPNTDLSFRWGGEEFIVLMPNTNNKKAYFLAENFRQTVKASKAFQNNSVSVGLVTCKGEINRDAFFDHVDKAMYKAKIDRNTVFNSGVASSKEEIL